MERLCDLHTHSYYSDGTYSPEELLQEAQHRNLTAIVLSDHNTVDGLPEFLAAGGRYAVEAIAGMEFTSEFEGEELHILGIFLKPEHFPQIKEMMAVVRKRKARSEKDLVDKLRAKGMDLSYEQISAATPDGNVNRAHIAAWMVKKGYVASSREAFDEWLSPKKGLYVPAQRLDAFDVIRLIKSMGAVAVLAHPFLSWEEEQLRRFLPQAAACGLDAMETLYPKYSEQTTKLAFQMAEEYGLLPSGGSDFHGGNKPEIQMGVGHGDLQVPSTFLEALRQRVD